MHSARPELLELLPERSELHPAVVGRFADADEALDAALVDVVVRQVLPQFGEETRHADDVFGAQSGDDLGVARQGVQPVADRRRAEFDHALIVGETGDEAAVDGTGQEHLFARSHPRRPVAAGVVVGEAVEVAGGVDDPAGGAGGAAGEADV